MFKRPREIWDCHQIGPMHVKIEAWDEDMERIVLEGEELLARAICHEMEHLDGHTYVEKAEDGLHDVEEEA